MKTLIIVALIAVFYSCSSFASDLRLAGSTNRGWVVLYSDPPGRVTVYRINKNPTSKNDYYTSYTEYPAEQCEFTASTFMCPAAGKSPLAGTRFVAKKLHDDESSTVYKCTKGCNKSLKIPKLLELADD